MGKKYDQGVRSECPKKLKWTHSEKNEWQMDSRNTEMVSERM
jgi:hypothetical protein